MNKIKNFWNVFLSSIKLAYTSVFRNPPERAVQKWRDNTRINFLAIFVSKLTNLAAAEATFEISDDSGQLEKISELCLDLEQKRYKIIENMLSDGDFFVFPSTNQSGEIEHSYIPQEQVRIVSLDGDEIREAYAIIDMDVNEDRDTLFLLRNHVLDEKGDLTISYKIVDGSLKPAYLKKWEFWKDEEIKFVGANHIGFGRYKTPADDRGLSPVYGVPLNFNCAEIEAKIFEDLKLIEYEFKNGKSVIFTDPRNLVKSKDLSGYKIAENVIPIIKREGSTSGNIDIFNPELRFSPHYSKLVSDMALYERQVGTSKGILTDNETTYTATATAVKRANSDTIALIDRIRNSVDAGNIMTLQADAVYLNIPFEMIDYYSDWYDPFEDPSEQWERLKEAKTEGAAETVDLIKWIFPSLDDVQIEEKIQRIAEENQKNSNLAIDRILRGE